MMVSELSSILDQSSHTSHIEPRVIGRYDTPVSCCCFITLRMNHTVLVLCMKENILVFKEPFTTTPVHIPFSVGSRIISVCGCTVQEGAYNVMLCFGHYSGSISTFLYNSSIISSWKQLSTVNMMDNCNRSPPPIKLQFSVDNNDKLGNHRRILIVLRSNSMIQLFNVDIESKNALLSLIARFFCTDLAVDMKLLNVDKYYDRNHKGQYRGVIVCGKDMVQLFILCLKTKHLIQQIDCRLEVPGQWFTSVTVVAINNEEGTNIRLFCGSSDGRFYKGKISHLLFQQRTNDTVLLSVYPNKYLHAFILAVLFSPNESSQKKISFHDRACNCIRC
jgi:hypothetical protein